MRKLSTSKGVTLIELLVVVVVIGVLASVVLMVINPLTQFKKGRDTRRKSDLAQIQAALEFYRTDKSYYPRNSDLPACGGAFTSGGATPTTYLQRMPCDPFDNVLYAYIPLPANCNNTSQFCTTYTLAACLEIITDPVADGTDGSASDACPLPGGSPANGRVSMTVRNP